MVYCGTESTVEVTYGGVTEDGHTILANGAPAGSSVIVLQPDSASSSPVTVSSIGDVLVGQFTLAPVVSDAISTGQELIRPSPS